MDPGRVVTISKTSRQTVNAYGLASNSKVLLTHNALFLGKDPNVTSNSKKWMLGYVENCIITGSSRTPLWKDRCETGQKSYCVKVQDYLFQKSVYCSYLQRNQTGKILSLVTNDHHIAN